MHDQQYWLSEVKRTLFKQPNMSANDPEQTQGRIRSPTAFEGCAALQLQMIAPSSPLSHSASDLQLSEFFISVQSFAPIQAHLDPSPGKYSARHATATRQMSPGLVRCPRWDGPLIDIDRFGKRLVGCIECNRWTWPDSAGQCRKRFYVPTPG